MPRMTNDEAIAAAERELEEAKAKAQEKIDAQIAKAQQRLAELKSTASERRAARIVKLDEQIEAALTRVRKAEAHLAQLQEQRAALNTDDGQDELPATDEEGDHPTAREPVVTRKRKSDAA